jgi:hypothetical protein
MKDDFNEKESDWILAFQSVLTLMPKTINLYDLNGSIIACKKGTSSRILGFTIAETEGHFDAFCELHDFHDKTITKGD